MTRRPVRIELEELGAFLDRELPPDRSAQIAEALTLDPELRIRLQDYEAQIGDIRRLYNIIANEIIEKAPEKFVDRLSRIVRERDGR